MVPWSLRFYSLLGWRHFHRAEPVIKRSQSPSIAMQDTITHFDGSFVHLTNRVLSHKSLDCMQLNIFQSGGCLPICSIDDNMKWILFYTCIFFVPVRLLFFFLFFFSFVNSSFAFYVSVQLRICTGENTTTVEGESALNMTRPFLSKVS